MICSLCCVKNAFGTIFLQKKRMMKRFLLAWGLIYICSFTHAQTVEQIKRNSDMYLYGEGKATSIQQADKQALDNIISQISVNISSGTENTINETQNEGDLRTQLEYKQIIQTYSQATLVNTQQIIIENEPDAHVFRYIRKTDVDRIFEARKEKIKTMVAEAQDALDNRQINDALRYYYWSHALVKSLRNPNELYVTNNYDGTKHMANVWIPKQINEILSNLAIDITQVKDTEAHLSIHYKNEPVNSIDYSYFDGRGWSNIHTAQAGCGLIELRTGIDMKRVQLKVEFAFINEAVVDLEVKEILAVVPNSVYKGAYCYLSLDSANDSTDKKQNTQTAFAHTAKKTDTKDVIQTRSYDDITTVTTQAPYLKIMKDLLDCITAKNTSVVQEKFTPQGFEAYTKLIEYGSARVVDSSKPKFYQFNNKVYCRNVLMNFSFKTNNRSFVENVVFEFDEEKKISNITFGLSRQATEEVFGKTVWPEQARIILTHFLEGYKSAYALKQIDYVASVFAEDALIITGSYVRKATNNDMVNLNYPNVQYTKQTKAEYMRRLRYIFQSNEYINIKFADNRIMKAGKGGEIYGIEIKQEYHSSSYGDTGYLFLMVDLNNPDKPIIHVRTWQPEKDPDFGVYGLEDF